MKHFLSVFLLLCLLPLAFSSCTGTPAVPAETEQTAVPQGKTFSVCWLTEDKDLFTEVTEGEMPVPPEVDKTVYTESSICTFTGWNKEIVPAAEADAKNGKIYYKATYTKEKRTYTVTFVADGKTVETRSLAYGTKFSADDVKIPAKQGYKYASWDTQDSTLQVKEDMTVTAVYTNYADFALTEYADCFHVNGRTRTVTVSEGDGLLYDFSAQCFSFTAECEGDVALQMVIRTSDTEGRRKNHYRIFVDGEEFEGVVTGGQTASLQTLTLAENLPLGTHSFEVYRCNEPLNGIATLLSVTMNGTPQKYVAPQYDRTVIFIGDSITSANYVLAKNGDPDEQDTMKKDGTKSFAFLTAKALHADYTIISRSGGNANREDESSLYPYYEKFSAARDKTVNYDFTLPAEQVDYYIITLCDNDITRGASDEEIRQRITDFVSRVRADHPDTAIIWTYGQLSQKKKDVVKAVVDDLAQTDGNLYCYIYTQGNAQGGVYHPNAEAHARDAEELTAFILQLEENR